MFQFGTLLAQADGANSRPRRTVPVGMDAVR
jgi:hypothetical protein